MNCYNCGKQLRIIRRPGSVRAECHNPGCGFVSGKVKTEKELIDFLNRLWLSSAPIEPSNQTEKSNKNTPYKVNIILDKDVPEDEIRAVSSSPDGKSSVSTLKNIGTNSKQAHRRR